VAWLLPRNQFKNDSIRRNWIGHPRVGFAPKLAEYAVAIPPYALEHLQRSREELASGLEFSW
jgi:hypothetical protein